MGKSDIIVGLDIGTTKICAVVGEATPDGVAIVGIGTSPSHGLRGGVVVHIGQTVESIRRALEDAELMAGCDIGTVYVGIAGSHIKGFNSHGVIAVKGDEVTQKDVDRAMDAAKAIAIPLDREVIHALPQEFIIDDQRGILEPKGMAGVRLEVEVHIVTGAVTSVQHIVRACHRGDLDVADIVLESLASAKAVLTEEERELGVALVDIGGGTTDIAIFHNDSIRYTSVLGLGGQNLTNDIAQGLHTPVASAEEIKLQYGCAMLDLVQQDEIIEVRSVGGRLPRRLPRSTIAEICQPRMDEMLFLVDQELTKSGCKHLIGAGVVLTGGTALLDGCQELSEQIFNLPTRIGYPLNTGGLRDVVASPQYATAVGLLCYGAENIGMEPRFPRTAGSGNMFGRILKSMRKWLRDIS